jgi:hypothetical protein
MISAEHIERAERLLKQSYAIGIGDRVILDRARVEPEAFEKFIRHHREVFFKQYAPDIDPRLEPSLLTMFRHFFAVGAIAQRVSDGTA